MIRDGDLAALDVPKGCLQGDPSDRKPGIGSAANWTSIACPAEALDPKLFQGCDYGAKGAALQNQPVLDRGEEADDPLHGRAQAP